jgi:ribonuclease HI
MITIYTDGGCEPNPGIGGWGFVAYEADAEIHAESGGKSLTTNNVMEMTALLNAVLWAKKTGRPAKSVTILSDSQYAVKGCNEWRQGWKKKGWRRGKDKPLSNADLWKTIDDALSGWPVKIKWVKGHAGIVGNERADALAGAGRSDQFNSVHG